MKKVIDELEYRKEIADVNIKKLDTKLKKYNGTLAAYDRKKMEFYKGKSEGYRNSLIIIEKFLDTGILPEIKEE